MYGLRDIFVNLSVIANLNVNEKLNCTYSQFHAENGNTLSIDTIFRTARRDTRRKTMDCVHNLLDQCLDIIEHKTYKEQTTKDLIGHLKACKFGLMNLMTTYEGDTNIKGSILFAIRKIQHLETKYPEIETIFSESEKREMRSDQEQEQVNNEDLDVEEVHVDE